MNFCLEVVVLLLLESFVGKCFYYYLVEALGKLKVVNVVTLEVTKGGGKLNSLKLCLYNDTAMDFHEDMEVGSKD